MGIRSSMLKLREVAKHTVQATGGLISTGGQVAGRVASATARATATGAKVVARTARNVARSKGAKKTAAVVGHAALTTATGLAVTAVAGPVVGVFAAAATAGVIGRHGDNPENSPPAAT